MADTQKIDESKIGNWKPQSATVLETVSEVLTRRLAAALDWPHHDWSVGSILPPGWHVTLFGPTDVQASLGPDGHAPKGTFLPPIEWPYRMFAGRRVNFVSALRVGDQVERNSRVESVTFKEGRSGPICFVTVRHELRVDARLALIEEQDIVYRPERRSAGPAPSAAESIHRPAGVSTRTVTPSAALLFRFSAVTNNAHRIHYDLPYATEVEGHPALVVNGSLPALMLWQLATESTERVLKRSSIKNARPMHVDQPLTLHVSRIIDRISVGWVTNMQGHTCLDGEFEWQ